MMLDKKNFVLYIFCNFAYIFKDLYDLLIDIIINFKCVNKTSDFNYYKKLKINLFTFIKMNFLIKSLSRSISYSIKSPLDLSLFKSPQSVEIVKKSLNARFRDEKIAD